jgi:hypothetical protein
MIRIHWEDTAEASQSGGGRLNQQRDGSRYESGAITVVTAQGAEIPFAGRLQAPDTFLSNKKHVRLIKLSLTGSVHVQGAPRNFELKLDPRSAPSIKERVDEIHFDAADGRLARTNTAR